MTPSQEREKLAAEDRTKQAMKRSACQGCYGRGLVTMGRYPTVVRCPDCKGTGRKE